MSNIIKITLLIDKKILKKIDKLAILQTRSRNKTIIHACKKYLQEQEHKD